MLNISPLWKLFIATAVVAGPFLLRGGATQYEIKGMVCEIYFADHEMGPDGCSVPEVDAAMAAIIAALTMLILISAMLSTFFATVLAKKIGLKRTLVFSVSIMSIVNGFYIAAIFLRGRIGVSLFFIGQSFGSLGGMGGFSLAVTAMISILTQEDGSLSAALGMLGGVMTTISAVFSFAGGFIYDWHHKVPFYVAVVWGAIAPIACLMLVPDLPLDTQLDSKTTDVLKVFGPRKIERHGKLVSDWSLVFAALGAGLSVVATSYTSTELNIIGMNSFGVTPQEMGALSAWNSLAKSIFFIFIFPPLSKAAFRYLDKKPTGEAQPLLEGETQPTVNKPSTNSSNLYLLMLSIVVELAAVIALAFSTRKWHLFALSTFIPQASGVGALIPALILHFVPPEKRADAVGASQLLDMTACTAAIVVFGYVFAWLSKMNMGQLVFLANGSVGILALVALLFVRMH